MLRRIRKVILTADDAGIFISISSTTFTKWKIQRVVQEGGHRRSGWTGFDMSEVDRAAELLSNHAHGLAWGLAAYAQAPFSS